MILCAFDARTEEALRRAVDAVVRGPEGPPGEEACALWGGRVTHAGEGTGEQVVFAIYRPKPGREKALEDLLARHVPTLRRLGLATDRPPLLLRSKDSSFVEVFGWVDGDAARKAHAHPEVAALWEAMGEVADFPGLADLPEARTRFAHFRPANRAGS